MEHTKFVQYKHAVLYVA